MSNWNVTPIFNVLSSVLPSLPEPVPCGPTHYADVPYNFAEGSWVVGHLTGKRPMFGCRVEYFLEKHNERDSVDLVIFQRYTDHPRLWVIQAPKADICRPLRTGIYLAALRNLFIEGAARVPLYTDEKGDLEVAYEERPEYVQLTTKAALPEQTAKTLYGMFPPCFPVVK
jgi:hypothetical protein